MISPSPTQSTPAGCFVAVFALFPAAITALGVYGLYRWWSQSIEQRRFDDSFWMLVAAVAAGSLVTMALLYLSKRLLTSTDLRGYNSKDPDEPTLKF